MYSMNCPLNNIESKVKIVCVHVHMEAKPYARLVFDEQKKDMT